MRVTVIGANGFVGSAFVRYLAAKPEIQVVPVTRANYSEHAGKPSDLVIEAACNSKKYLSDKEPLVDFEASVAHRFRTLVDFPAGMHLHISSVDVYSELSSADATKEDAQIDIKKTSNYGFHKLLAEQLVQRYAKKWLIVRLAGMVGPNLRKNPVFDILNGRPLFIHPDSAYQFIGTDVVAGIVWNLFESGSNGEIYNLAGEGLISPREIGKLAGKDLDLMSLPSNSVPRVVNVNIEKVRGRFPIPDTGKAVLDFIQAYKAAAGSQLPDKS
jgi:nucleoside-diphosphate-sugar epimerase